jgi:uncharacterized membrane protein YqaE (UPF0057 family)
MLSYLTVRQQLKKQSIQEQSTMQLIQIVLAIVLPPVGVFLAYGFSSTLLINIGLTILGWIPGVIHAFWAISKKQD